MRQRRYHISIPTTTVSVHLGRLDQDGVFRIPALKQHEGDTKLKVSNMAPRGPAEMPCFIDYAIKIQRAQGRGVKASETAKNGEILLLLLALARGQIRSFVAYSIIKFSIKPLIDSWRVVAIVSYH